MLDSPKGCLRLIGQFDRGRVFAALHERSHPALAGEVISGALAAHAALCESLPVFQTVAQRLTVELECGTQFARARRRDI
jgi:hypothetical protein